MCLLVEVFGWPQPMAISEKGGKRNNNRKTRYVYTQVYGIVDTVANGIAGLPKSLLSVKALPNEILKYDLVCAGEFVFESP